MLYSGEIIDNTYKIVNEIGSGGMGVVYLAFHLRLEKYVVMKKFKGDVSNVSLLRNEVYITLIYRKFMILLNLKMIYTQ